LKAIRNRHDIPYIVTASGQLDAGIFFKLANGYNRRPKNLQEVNFAKSKEVLETQ
jgi:hypothetical protein